MRFAQLSNRTYIRQTSITMLVVFACFCLQESPSIAAPKAKPTAKSNTSSGNVDLPRYPAISPNGKQVLFTWRGDLWRTSFKGGTTTRMTSHPGDEYRSAWSKDGKTIAFNSARNGYNNIYTMAANGTNIKQITEQDVSCILTGFGKDAQGRPAISFYSWQNADAYYAARPFTVRTHGGQPHTIHDAFGSEPAISPDGKHVAFTRGNNRWYRKHSRSAGQLDVWLYTYKTKAFKQLTNWQGNDGKPKWLNNDTIIFASDRKSKTVNLYKLNINKPGKSAQTVTNFINQDVFDYDIASKSLRCVINVWDKLYTLDLSQQKTQPKLLKLNASTDEADRFTIKNVSKNVTEAALSPDGKTMAVVAYGEIFIRAAAPSSPTRRITDSPAHEKHIVWSPDGLRLYFTSDRDGTESIYQATVSLTRGEIKSTFKKQTQPSTPKAKNPSKKKTTPKEPTKPAPEPTVKPTPASSKTTPQKTTPTTPTTKPAAKPTPTPKHLNPTRWQDAIRFAITPVIQAKTHDREPSPSPDGKSLAFRRGLGDLVILNRITNKTHTIAKGWDTGLHWSWSPDSKHIAYCHADRDFNYDIWIASASPASNATKKPINITRHPDNDYNPTWSADGKVLSFVSERVNEELDVWSVYLDKSLQGLPRNELNDYYKTSATNAKKRKPIAVVDFTPPKADKTKDTNTKKKKPAASKSKAPAATSTFPSTWSLEDAYRRVRRVTSLDGNESNNTITPGGDYYLFTATGGYDGFWIQKWDGTGRKKIGSKVSLQHLTLTGDKAVVVQSGRAAVISLAGATSYIDIAATIKIDLQQQASQKFLEAARILGERFYHPTMKGLDWPKLTDEYHQLAKATRTSAGFNIIASRFIGELNASHLAVRSPSASTANKQSIGRLGTLHQRTRTGFKVTHIIPNSPAQVSPSPLKTNDIITAINLKPLGKTTTLETELKNTAGKETIITVNRKVGKKSQPLRLLITPTTWTSIRNLRYAAWHQHNADVVNKLSKGKLGYLHIRSMNQSSLDEYERDLYAAAHGKKGLLIDVRNNGGGWTTDRLLASIMTKPHAYTVPRGSDPKHKDGYPQDRLFIQRYSLPINMLCNEKSVSNAEIISHAFKTFKRGTLVGQTTYGGVISTGRTTLVDGTLVSLPFRGWYLPNGTDMENNGAIPHLLIPQTPQAEADNKDEQLQGAVQDLLKRIK